MTDIHYDHAFFDLAIDEARQSLDDGGVPVGAALVIDGTLVATGHNERVQAGDPIAHGEIACLRKGGRQESYRDAVLYTTLAPCSMCAGAIVLFGIPIVVVGESATFEGELEFMRARGVDVVVLDDPRCIKLMKSFQARYPRIWAEDIGRLPDRV